MTVLSDLAALEAVDTTPLFPVQPPDGRRDWTELQRQTALFRTMRFAAPTVLGFAIPNAGKRNPVLVRREGIMAGVFDTAWLWSGGSAWLELKGYDARGRAGSLTTPQVEWGNRMHRLGKSVACFFDPITAAEWLRDLGAPVNMRGAV